MGKHDIEIRDGDSHPTYLRGHLFVPLSQQRWQRLQQIAKAQGKSVPAVVAEWVDVYALEDRYHWTPPGMMRRMVEP